MPLRHLLTVAALLILPTRAHAFYDCAFFFESKRQLEELHLLIEEVHGYRRSKTKGLFDQFHEWRGNYNNLRKIDDILKQLGIQFSRSGMTYTFSDKGNHPLNSIGKYLKKRGLAFKWVLKDSRANAEMVLDEFAKGDNDEFFRRVMKEVRVSSKTFQAMLIHQRHTHPTVRHELIHVQTLVNFNRKIEGYFYGEIFKFTPNAQKVGYKFDEIPAQIETIVGYQEWLKSLPDDEEFVGEMKESIERAFNSIRVQAERTYSKAHDMIFIYQSLIAILEKKQWVHDKLVSDEDGIFIDNLMISSETREVVTVILSRKPQTLNKKLDKEWVKQELQARLNFFQTLAKALEINSMVETPETGPSQLPSTAVLKYLTQDQLIVTETLKKAQTLQELVKPVWAIQQ